MELRTGEIAMIRKKEALQNLSENLVLVRTVPETQMIVEGVEDRNTPEHNALQSKLNVTYVNALDIMEKSVVTRIYMSSNDTSSSSMNDLQISTMRHYLWVFSDVMLFVILIVLIG